MLWIAGGVEPVPTTEFSDGKLIIKCDDWRIGWRQNLNKIIIGTLDQNKIHFSAQIINKKGEKLSTLTFDGVKIPPLPPRPNLKTLKFGKPINLLQKDSLEGWVPMSKAPNGWSMKDGVLSNRVEGPDGKRRSYTNIKTVKTFTDFNLKTDVRILPNGNSGIYLRGIYEIQMIDSYGKKLDSHNMGALYSRITPSVAAEKPANIWQTVDITLVDRHVTVILNGKTIIDNQPVLGCTGGALITDESLPGPIFLQGDHADVDYRNMVLTPILK